MQHYDIAKIKKRNRHQHNTYVGGQAMGEEMSVAVRWLLHATR